MRRLLVGSTVIVSLMMACSPGSDHNPLRDYSQPIQEGIPPTRKVPPPPRKPVPQDALIIDADEIMVFSENVEQSYRVAFRTFKADLVTAFTIESAPDDFKDWYYDSNKGLLTWKPPSNFTEGEFARHFQVTLRYSVPSEGIGTVKTVEFIVYREESIPEIVRVAWPQGRVVREGAVTYFEVEVRDRGGTRYPPLLSIIDNRNAYQKNGSGLVSFAEGSSREPNPSLLANGNWLFKMVFSANQELTKDQDSYYFGLQASNRYGIRSQLAKEYAEVRSKVLPALVSWIDDANSRNPDAIVTQGQNSFLSFTVMAPNGEGKVSLNWQTRCDRDLAGVAVCRCTPTSNNGVLNCSVDWLVKQTTEKYDDYVVRFEVINQGSEVNNFAVTKVERVIRAIQQIKQIPQEVLK